MSDSDPIFVERWVAERLLGRLRENCDDDDYYWHGPDHDDLRAMRKLAVAVNVDPDTVTPDHLLPFDDSRTGDEIEEDRRKARKEAFRLQLEEDKCAALGGSTVARERLTAKVWQDADLLAWLVEHELLSPEYATYIDEVRAAAARDPRSHSLHGFKSQSYNPDTDPLVIERKAAIAARDAKPSEDEQALRVMGELDDLDSRERKQQEGSWLTKQKRTVAFARAAGADGWVTTMRGRCPDCGRRMWRNRLHDVPQRCVTEIWGKYSQGIT